MFYNYMIQTIVMFKPNGEKNKKEEKGKDCVMTVNNLDCVSANQDLLHITAF